MQLKELEYALENAKISYALQQLSIEKNVTSQFYDVYQKQKDLNISRDEYNNQKQNYDIIKNKVEAGLLAKEELYQAEVNLANSESTVYSKELFFLIREGRATAHGRVLRHADVPPSQKCEGFPPPCPAR